MYAGIPEDRLTIGAKFISYNHIRKEKGYAYLIKIRERDRCYKYQFRFFRKDGTLEQECWWVENLTFRDDYLSIIGLWRNPVSIKKLKKKSCGKYTLVKVS